MKQNEMIYLDSAAAAAPATGILDFYREKLAEYYANQEAAHGFAFEIRQKLKDAETELSEILTGDPRNKVAWCSSASDGFAACLSSLRDTTGKNIVTTGAEHPALASAVARIPEIDTRTVKLTLQGLIDLEHLDSLIDANTIMVALHHVQSETGVIQDLPAVRKAIDRKKIPGIKFLADTVQSAGKLPLPWLEAKLDLAFVSGPKIGVPGGGAVICRFSDDYMRITNLRTKEHQTGRVNPALAMTLTEAFRELGKNREKEFRRISELNRFARAKLAGVKLNNGRDPVLTIPEKLASPWILHMMLPNYQGAILTRMLSKMNIMAAAGSACEAENNTPSRTLTVMGYKKTDAFSGMRISFWRNTTRENIDEFITALQQILINY